MPALDFSSENGKHENRGKAGRKKSTLPDQPVENPASGKGGGEKEVKTPSLTAKSQLLPEISEDANAWWASLNLGSKTR